MHAGKRLGRCILRWYDYNIAATSENRTEVNTANIESISISSLDNELSQQKQYHLYHLSSLVALRNERHRIAHLTFARRPAQEI
jgi:hypothetical protein